MCYKSPGPRCYSHASQDMYRLQAKFQEASADHSKLIEEYNAKLLTVLSHKDQETPEAKAAKSEYLSIQGKVDASDRKLAALDEKRQEAVASANATVKGIDLLEQQLADAKNRGYGGEFIELELNEAKERYEKNMLDYDKINGTVYGRKPSSVNTEEGLAELRERYETGAKAISRMRAEEEQNGVDNQYAISREMEAQERLKDQMSHASNTVKRINQHVIPNQAAVNEHLNKASEHTKAANESWERSDTDGFMSQWASGVMAEHHRMRAELESNGGKAEFPALFDKDGNMVPAKRLTVADRYNGGQPKEVWGILEDPKDPNSGIKEWVNDSKAKGFDKKEAAMAKKGYTVGLVRAPAYVAERGANLVNVRSVFVRADGGYNPEAEVVTKNIYPRLIQEDKEREAQNRANFAESQKLSKKAKD